MWQNVNLKICLEISFRRKWEIKILKDTQDITDSYKFGNFIIWDLSNLFTKMFTEQVKVEVADTSMLSTVPGNDYPPGN